MASPMASPTLSNRAPQEELGDAVSEHSHTEMHGDAEHVGEAHLPVPNLSIAWMDWLCKEEYLEPDWRSKPHIHLDFSDRSLFVLHTFQPEDFDWGGKPTKDNVASRNDKSKTTLPVFKLVSLNLNDNKLNDSVFEFKLQKTKSLTGQLFANLRILKINDNLLQFPQILLPQLRELYLSRNQIVWIPLLGGLPKLEVLVLSHNQIQQIRPEQFEENSKSMPKLKTLDLSANMLDLRASTSHAAFQKFKRSLSLQVLMLKDNPFCNYFSEYQLLAVYHLDQLEKLDDIDLDSMPELREEMKKQAAMYFGVDRLDEAEVKKKFRELNGVIEERKRPAKGVLVNEERKRAHRVPTLPDLVKLLDDAIAEPDSASTYITLVFEDACHLMRSGPDTLRKAIEADRKGVVREALTTFVQLALILVERYPESRMMLLKSIAKFAMVTDRPLAAIAHLAMGGGAPMEEVMKVLEDNALSELTRPQSVSADSFRIVVTGLAQFDSESDELAEAIERFKLVNVLCLKLQPMMHQFLSETDPQGPFQSALLSVLRCAVRKRENALAAMNLCDEFANRMSDMKEFHDGDRYATDLYLNVAEILCSCVKVDTARALADIDPRFPYNLINLVSQAFMKLKKADTTDRLSFSCCKKIAAVIDVLTAVMQDPAHMEGLLRIGQGEGARDNALMKLILRSPSETSTDPLILGASLDCCSLILLNANASQHHQYLLLMVIDMGLEKDNLILPYVEAKKFKDLYRRCAMHQAVTAAEEKSIMTASVPEFNGVTNRLVHKSITSIVKFLGVFSILEDDEANKELCAKISKNMDEGGRDRCLLKLLEMPSDDVRDAVLECMKTVDPSQFDSAEIEQMFDMLNPEDVKKEEQLMGQILALFLTLLQDDTEEADEFCLKYSKKVLVKTIEILLCNAARNTHGVEADEEQKAALSLSAIELIFVASKKKQTRQHMRSAQFSLDFRTILLNEMIFNSINVPDINLEISWTGRAVENLLACLSGSERLLPNKRQGFRILNRIADVMEGGSDTFRRFDITSQERALAESRMWNDQRIKTQVTYVDDMEFDDRTNQQQSFVSFHAVDRLLTFLEGHPSALKKSKTEDSDEVVLEVQDSLNGQDLINTATGFFKKVKEHATHSVSAQAAIVKEEFDRDFEREVPLDEPEDEEIGNHEDILRQCYMECGWQSSNTVQKAVGFSIPPQPKVVKLDESYFCPGTQDEISIVYPLAAVLRSFYALLVVPAVELLRIQTIATLRETSLQIRLISLIDCHGRMVDCHLAAKYLRVMSLALRMFPDQTVMHMSESNDHKYVLGLSMGASFAARCLRLLTPLLANMGRGYMLTIQQQTLCMEAMRMLAVVSSAAPYIKLSHSSEIQAECTEYALSHFIPMSTVTSVVLCLLYDMQVNVGSSHGSFINAKYVRSSMQRQGLRELCSDVLTNIIQACTKMRYDIFELFYKQEVLGKVALRASFLNELIKRVAQLKYVFAMESMIQERNFEPGERILRCCECELPLAAGGGFKFSKNDAPRMLVLTSKRLLIMERPKHGMMLMKCGHCPPESFCPVGPSIESEHSYSDMTRVIRGADSQMFAIGFVDRHKLTGEIQSEAMQIMICHRSDERRGVVETLCTMSGPDVEKRVQPQRDMLIKQTTEKRLETPPVCMSFAFRVETGKMFLFILSEATVCEADINFGNWIPPFENIAAPDVSDDETEGMMGDDDDPTMLADENVKVHKDRLVQRRKETDAQKWLSANKETFGMQYNSIWANKDGEEVDKVWEDRNTAMSKFKSTKAEEEKQGQDAVGNESANSGKHLLQNVMRKARANIFIGPWNTWKMQDIASIEFDAGEFPVLKLDFKTPGKGTDTDPVSIRFLDDVARERWRRGLAYILNKSDTAAQWQRQWKVEKDASI